MRPFEHRSVSTAAEAVSALAAAPSSALIAGGAELLSLMKANLAAPTQLIDLKPARELRGVTYPDDGSVRIGALTTLAEIERDPTLAERLPILRAAVRDAATLQLRNMATVGGNLLQRTRCWYFRGEYICWQKGGNQCFARGGQNKYHAIFDDSPCVAVHPSDLAPALLALDATVSVIGPQGERTLTIDELLQPPIPERRHEATLNTGEVLTAITIPAHMLSGAGAYLKLMDRQAWAYALVSAAAQLTVTDGIVRQARVVLGGVSNTPRRLHAVESALEGQTLTPEVMARASEHAVEGAEPLAHNRYKVKAARELTRRVIAMAGRHPH